MLGPIITEFMQCYPEVRISLAATDRMVNLFDEAYDVAIRFRAAPLRDSNLIASFLGESRTYLVASPALIEKYGYPAQLADLSRLNALGNVAATSRMRGN